LPITACACTNGFPDAFGKIETQAMGDASTAIVGTHKELLVPKMTHRLDLVQCHRSERVIEVAISAGRKSEVEPLRSGSAAGTP
jgi:hypothetical protein